MSSNRRHIILAQIESWNKWSMEDTLRNRSEDCMHQVLPKSLGVPPMNNAAFQKHIETNVLPNYRNFKFEIDDIIEDEKESKVVVLGHSSADTDIGRYQNEYVFVAYFDEDGTKIVRLLEFVDSVKMVTFVAELRAHAAAKVGTDINILT